MQFSYQFQKHGDNDKFLHFFIQFGKKLSLMSASPRRVNKNDLTKSKPVCTQVNVIFTPIPNMVIKVTNSDILNCPCGVCVVSFQHQVPS